MVGGGGDGSGDREKGAARVASHADVLTGSSRNQREPLRTFAWEATARVEERNWGGRGIQSNLHNFSSYPLNYLLIEFFNP